MAGIVNILDTINNYWTYILIIVGIVIYMANYYKKYQAMTEEEQLDERKRLVDLALSKVKEILPSLVALAEEDWNHLEKSGIIKRSQVVNNIYEQYPILKEYTNQAWLTKKIDEYIDAALKDIRNITR